MKLALHIGMWGPAPTDRYVELAQRAEALGFDMVATSENYGSDVFTPLTAIANHTSTIGLSTCVMPIQSRTPASAAMTAITLDHISNGRMSLGVGVATGRAQPEPKHRFGRCRRPATGCGAGCQTTSTFKALQRARNPPTT